MNMDVISKKTSSSLDKSLNKPSPGDFDIYLPWACNQLQVAETVVCIREVQDEYVSIALTDRSKARGKKKAGQSYIDVDTDREKEDKSTSVHLQQYANTGNIVRIFTIYDSCENVVQIKFDKNKNVPRTVLKIIGLMGKFHMYLTAMSINKGLDKYSIHEICKLLPLTHITDICLDGTYLEIPNYYMLLENANRLRYVSLARCKIDDMSLKKIAENLIYPLPSSKTLSVLNLATNSITDIGVQHLAEALKSNRRLVYLNLADNMITDDGASAIFNILTEFQMSVEELISARQRRIEYLKQKKDLTTKYVLELKLSDERKLTARKKAARPSSFPGKKLNKGMEKELSLKAMNEVNKSLINFDNVYFEKAEMMAVNALGSFTDPFSTTHTVSKDGVVYCSGNNYLSYLNLSYNNLSYLVLKKLLNVLLYQKFLNKRPKGLMNVCIEGNNLPITCKELSQIDELLEMGLMSHRRQSIVRKKPATRSGK